MRKTINSFLLISLTTFFVYILWPHYPGKGLELIIVFGSLLIFLVSLLWLDRVRQQIFSITLFNLISLPRFYFFIFSIILSGIFLLYYALSSRSDDNILPDKLQFNVIETSAILGTLVLAVASLKSKGITPNLRNKLFNISFELIASTVSLIFFTVFSYYAYKDGTPILFSWDPSSWANVFRGIFLIGSLICFFLGQPLFIMGTIDLLSAVFRIAKASNVNNSLLARKNNIVFHIFSCDLIKDVPENELRKFATSQEALNKGYYPCPKCTSDKR